jgi:TPR repeat protein
MRLVLGLVVLAMWQSLVVAAVPAADALWDKGDYRGAFAEAIEPAIRGDADAQFMIGEAYRLGRSVDPNFPQAEEWYARAARQGHIGAATELGLLLAGQHREAEALPWLTMAAQHNEPRALCSLAALYFNGDGVERDEAYAYALMVRAARTGLPEAKTRLATLRSVLSDAAQNRGEELLATAIPTVATPPPIQAAPQQQLVVAEPPQRAAQVAPTARRQSIVRVAVATTAPSLSVHSPTAAFRVQVGAFRSAAAAHRAWGVLAARVNGLEQINYAVVRAGAFYRLQARLPDRDSAMLFCGRLKSARWQHFTRQGTVRA